jgi:5'-3' exonuclease
MVIYLVSFFWFNFTIDFFNFIFRHKMGVSGLHGQWLRAKNYRGVIIREMPKYVSSFCVDFNHIIHKAAGLIYGYHPHSPERLEYVKKTMGNALEIEFFKQITSLLMDLIYFISPRDVLIIAVDGVAPQAKIQQQRQRRYKSAMTRTADSNFDSNSITPGTEMMVRLDAYLTTWVKQEGYNINMPKMVIYSGNMTPGEGEHKIMDFVRAGVLDGEGAHIVYGLDADLIFLSLLAPLDRIYLYREDSEEIIDIDNLREAIISETKNNHGVSDFVFMMSMVGNDFLPSVPSLKNKKESIDAILQAYVEVGRSIITDDRIRWDAFIEVLDKLSLQEKDFLSALSLVKTEYPIEAFAGSFDKQGQLDMKKFRPNWYYSHLEPKGSEEDIEMLENLLKTSLVPAIDIVVKEMVNKYFLGMAWVYTYYTKGVVNYSYLYDHFFAPLLSDLSNADAPSPDDYLYNEEIKMFPPFYQLISVIPPGSVAVLPNDLQKLYKPSSPIIDMLPTRVIVDLQGATFDERNHSTREWEGVVIVPPVDINRVIDAVQNLDISTRKWANYNPKEVTTIVKPPELETAEREQRLLAKNVKQDRINKNRNTFGHDPNAWRATHILF